MEYPLELKKNSRDKQTSGRVDKISSPQASQSRKLQDRLKSENPKLSYADLHHEIIKNVDDIPPRSVGNHQKQRIERKATEDDELVKYMSDLPSYLERGKNLQEKALNVGVLDWGRLEKWQYNNKQIPNRSSRSSTSTSSTSSFFSTDGSSTHSSRGHRCSPTRQRMHRPTLQAHLSASPKEGYSQGVNSFGGNAGKFQDLKASQNNSLNKQQKFLRTDQSFCKNHSEIKLEQCKRKDSDPKIVPEMGTLPNIENYEVASCSKGNMKTLDGELTKRAENSRELDSNIVDQEYPKRHQKVVLLLPRDLPQKSHSGVCPHLSDSTTINDRRSTEAARRSFSDTFNSKEVHHAEHYSEIPHSCPLPCEVDGSKHARMKQPTSIDAESIKFTSDASHSLPRLAKTLISPSRCKNPEVKKLTMTPTSSTVIKPSEGSDLKTGTVASAKVRNPSPTRRFSIGMGRIGRRSSSKEGSAIPQLSSTNRTAKSGPERPVASACLDNSSNDKPNAGSRARSSPLRRLLDPLLKPKASNPHHFAEPLQKNSTSTDRACKSSDGRLDSSTPQSVKVKLDLAGCRTIDVNDSYEDKKHGSSAVQALLQVAVKNGLPLFTFAVDNNNILAATMKLGTSRKDDYCWIYTFFTFHEIKKKNRKSWIDQGGKGKGHGYIPNVIAQMKVSDFQFSNLASHMDQFSVREFVLFAVDLRHADQQTSDFQPDNELAAIVVKLPKETTGSLSKDGQQNDNSGENVRNGPSVGSRDLFSTTVILPSGVHGLSSKGEPSPLIERWKLGGLCDCGGWDLGCELRVLANRTQRSKKSSSSRDRPTTDRFELFPQGGVQDNRPVFSLAPFSDGIFSVEFNSSLSLLQAFSICIAVLNSRKLFELSEPSNFFEEKTSGETTLMQNDGIKAPNQTQGEVPARYVSYPPLSPFGRV